VASPKMLGRVFRPAEGVFLWQYPDPVPTLRRQLETERISTLYLTWWRAKTVVRPAFLAGSLLAQLIAPEIFSIPVSGEALSEPRSRWTADGNRVLWLTAIGRAKTVSPGRNT